MNANNVELTLVPLPGHEQVASRVKEMITRKRNIEPTIVVPRFATRASGEPFLQLGEEGICGQDCVVITSGPGTYEMRGQVEDLLGYLVGRNADRITLVTGYFPLSRSDKDEGKNELALLPHVVHLFKAAAYYQLAKIIAVDLHSAQVVMAAGRMGLIEPIGLGKRILKRVIEDARKETEKICIFLPDEGASKQYEGTVKDVLEELGLKLPVAQGIKRRMDSQKSKIVGIIGDVDEISGSLVICLDDEIATLGTQAGTAEKLKGEYGADRFWAASIHGVLCGNALARIQSSEHVDKAYVTDTIPIRDAVREVSDERLQVVSWHDDLANIIYFYHIGHPIRTLR